MVGCSVIASARCDRGAATNRTEPISHPGHLKILGSPREAPSTVAVAADACANRRHRPGEPIATLCGNDDFPWCRFASGRGAGRREPPSQQLGLYQSIIAWLSSLSHLSEMRRASPAPKGPRIAARHYYHKPRCGSSCAKSKAPDFNRRR
jgi:hypothetical protein